MCLFIQRLNPRRKIDGQLFHGRYRAVLIDADQHFLEVLRYVHRNLIRANVVEALGYYRWSSHRAAHHCYPFYPADAEKRGLGGARRNPTTDGMTRSIAMAYTPELDLATVQIVRRIAWSMDLPMTVALPAMIAWLAIHLDSQKIRTACRAPVDCDDCPFSAEKVEKM